MSTPKKTIFTGDPTRAAQFTGRVNGGHSGKPKTKGCLPGCAVVVLALAALSTLAALAALLTSRAGS